MRATFQIELHQLELGKQRHGPNTILRYEPFYQQLAKCNGDGALFSDEGTPCMVIAFAASL